MQRTPPSMPSTQTSSWNSVSQTETTSTEANELLAAEVSESPSAQVPSYLIRSQALFCSHAVRLKKPRSSRTKRPLAKYSNRDDTQRSGPLGTCAATRHSSTYSPQTIPVVEALAVAAGASAAG